MQNQYQYKDRQYTIVNYNPSWITQFNNEAIAFKSIFGADAIKIEHVGSTAVPGMSGKPTIDILILVDNITVINTYISKIESIGYTYKGAYVTEDSRLFVKETSHTRLYNVHIFPAGHPHAKEMLRVRDYFRSHLDAVREYAELKLNLYQKYPTDYASYRQYKDKWMNNLINVTMDSEVS